MTNRPIKKLPIEVINKIAAGEVLQRPSNAIKELLENCIDASCTQIQILIKNGGYDLLKVQDNGCGINKDDLFILCERFTTSKLTTYTDLRNISTFGFRGEALASLSQVSNLTVITKTTEAECAYKAKYKGNKLIGIDNNDKAVPIPCAGNNGTQIIAENLFYNLKIRKQTFKNQSEEYNKILDVVTKYAIHNEGIDFVCKKANNNKIDMQTNTINTKKERICKFINPNLKDMLLSFETKIDKIFEMSGLISKKAHSSKKSLFIIFINNRLVDHSLIKRSIESVYSSYSMKTTYPFVYLDIKVNPLKIDVNVHPSKKEVHILDEDKVVMEIMDCIQSVLHQANSFQIFNNININTPKNSPLGQILQIQTQVDSQSTRISELKNSTYNQNSPSPKNKVRTDYKDQHLYTFCRESTPHKEILLNKDNSQTLEFVPKSGENEAKKTELEMEFVKNINTLITEYKNACNLDVMRILNEHKYVGIVDIKNSLFQYNTQLIMINHEEMIKQLIYQRTLSQVPNMPSINIESHIYVKDIIDIILEVSHKQLTKDQKELQTKMFNSLISQNRSVLELFSIRINEYGKLLSLPQPINGFVLTEDYKILEFMSNLLSIKIWDLDRKSLYKHISHSIAELYYEPPLRSELTANNSKEIQKINTLYEAIVFKESKTDFFPSTEGFLMNIKNIKQVVSLPSLYKIFERC